jgi:uncharacterized phage-associated protein
MKRKSIDLAKHIIFLLNKKGEGYAPNNTKVQKLLYAYVGFAMRNKIPKDAVIDELPEAWKHGPVFPRVFSMIKNEKLPDIGRKMELTKQEEKVMNKTVNALGKFSAGKLSTWSHLSGSPWDIVWNVQENEYGKIPLELIKEYFTNEIENIL